MIRAFLASWKTQAPTSTSDSESCLNLAAVTVKLASLTDSDEVSVSVRLIIFPMILKACLRDLRDDVNWTLLTR